MTTMRTFVAGIGLLLVLAFLGGPLAAQENRVGLVAGVSIASLGGDDSGDPDSSLGLDVGAYLSWEVAESWAIRPGIYYVQKGAEATDAGGTLELNLDYVELPVLLEYRIPTEGALGVHLFGGPAVAFEVSCELELSGSGVSATVDCTDPNLDGGFQTSSVDFGIMLGGGLRFSAGGSVDLVVEGSYNLGLTSIDDSPEDNDIKNRAFQINAGLSIPVGG